MADTVLFGRYRLLAAAGSGGTAEVWRAIDEQTSEEVALKRLHPIVFGSENGRRRLAREFRSLRALDHPNVVRVRDLLVADDEAALILDYVPGTSLADRLRDGPPPTETDAVRIASDVAAALSAAHKAGIVHRDVKPGNILLGPDGRARLTDFGIAHSDGDDTAVTATGMLVGTLRYIAPEQLRGEPATRSSDLYSLAAVTYEMAAGRPAFAATTAVGLVEEQRDGPPPLVGAAAPLDAPVRRAMSADPKARQRSVDAFARDLRRAAKALPGAAAAAVAAPEATAEPQTEPIGARAGFAAVWAGAPLVEADKADVEPAAVVAAPVGRPSRRGLMAGSATRSRPGVLAAIAGIAFAALLLLGLTLTGGGRPTGAVDANVVTPAPTKATPKPTPKPTLKPVKKRGHGHDKRGGGDED
jgi:eukaryotic-like serine/threonine-protein kinase